ncbi:SCAN domain-containing protein 3 [Araneus ventricosus]|uniref:SCAN domain-containing protein 3 n=1 Tax=Araneus ventricosus TaxID=182803 RepID=A0A4Y2K1T0_ARAVE|nr:SCAN domain-containing protein 3 [Araneus ventricosus]
MVVRAPASRFAECGFESCRMLLLQLVQQFEFRIMFFKAMPVKFGSFFFELNSSRLCLELSSCKWQWRCSFGKEKVCIALLSVHRYFLMFISAWCTYILCLKSPLAAHFSDKVWVAKLAYLCDIFSLFNELNLCLQGKMTTVFKLADKVAAFKAKLELWGRRVNRGNLDMLQTLAGILGETEHSFSQLVHDHLPLLLKEFERYFPTTKDPRTGKEWIRDPFANKSGESSMSVQEDQLLEIANDSGLKTTFETTTLLVFWIKVMAEYPEIATRALKSLLPFPTTYLCKAGFSAVTTTKTKQWNKLDLSSTLRVSLSPITSRWNRLVVKKLAQGSHLFSVLLS